MKKFVLLLAASLTGAAWMSAQETQGVCGTSADDQLTERLLANIEKVNAGQAVSNRGSIRYVPIHFHLVGDASGDGKVKENKVLDQLCALNAAYEPFDIRFYLSPHPTIGTLFDYTINATNVYTNQSAWLSMHNKRHPNALNVYIVDNAESGNPTSGGITLAYYNIPRDWVVSRRDRVNGQANNSTLPHEVGHFFSLLHTFNGWDFDKFDPSSPGWPIAPALSPLGVPCEKMDGSNCTTAGDYICDTPPDYNFGYGNSGCTYTAGAKDPMGVLIDPMENNMMGYFESCAKYEFTAGQAALISADLASSTRNYLDNNFTPAATTITTPTDLLIAPVGNQTTAYFDEVLLEWKPVDGATYYLVDVDIVSSFVTPSLQTFVVSSTSKLVTTLQASRTYFWRVRPFNEYVACASVRQGSFKTPAISATHTIEDLNAWNVAPNPVTGNTLGLRIDAKKGFDAKLLVVTATGQVVFENAALNISSGETSIELPLNNLQNGLYFAVLRNNEGQSVRKFSVMR